MWSQRCFHETLTMLFSCWTSVCDAGPIWKQQDQCLQFPLKGNNVKYSLLWTDIQRYNIYYLYTAGLVTLHNYISIVLQYFSALILLDSLIAAIKRLWHTQPLTKKSMIYSVWIYWCESGMQSKNYYLSVIKKLLVILLFLICSLFFCCKQRFSVHLKYKILYCVALVININQTIYVVKL